MNVQRIFEALDEDMRNSALGIICSELESQGYTVKINELGVTSSDFFEGKLSNLENSLEPLVFDLFRNGNPEQRFSVEFLDFHEIAIRKAGNLV